jgi:hypothetical protein
MANNVKSNVIWLPVVWLSILAIMGQFAKLYAGYTDQSIVSVKRNSINTAGGNKRRLKDLKTFVTATSQRFGDKRLLSFATYTQRFGFTQLYVMLVPELLAPYTREVWLRN